MSEMLQKLRDLRDFYEKANTMQRMAHADQLATTAINAVIALIEHQSKLEQRINALEARNAQGQ